MERQNGWYKVKIDGTWTCARFNSFRFETLTNVDFLTHSLSESELDEVGEFIDMPGNHKVEVPSCGRILRVGAVSSGSLSFDELVKHNENSLIAIKTDKGWFSYPYDEFVTKWNKAVDDEDKE